ncbi:MAG: right-handed parallel beta-helix repeat-containing protein, partial [Candidatus Cloacimonadales bacterium]
MKSSKHLLIFGLILLTATLAWAQVTLTSPTVAALGTTDTVTPTLSWTTDLNPTPHVYTVAISKSPTMTNPVKFENINAINYDIGDDEFLDYNTTYYWQVQAYNSSSTEYGNPSEIGMFTTPKMSVAPHLRWAEIVGPDDYTVQLSVNADYTNPIIKNTSDTYIKIDTPLKYNQKYYWRVKKGDGAWANKEAFTTKALNVISETYKVSGTELAPYTLIAFGDVITYEAVTDEFEDLRDKVANVGFTYSSTILNQTPQTGTIKYKNAAPESYQSTLTVSITAKRYDGTPTSFPSIDITDNEILSLKLQYGNELKLTTPTSSYVPVNAITSYTNSDYSADEFLYDVDADNIYIKFASAALADNNNTIKVIIKNKNNNQELIRYAFKATNDYRLALTKAEINSITRVGLADRISIYPANQSDKTKDFIWLGNTPGINAISATVNPTSILPNQSFTVTAINLIRVKSVVDPVGFVLNMGRSTVTINPGIGTDIATNTIETGFGANSISIVKLDGEDFDIPVNVTVNNYTLVDFNMQAPSNFTLDADIYPRFQWSSATNQRGIDDSFHYKIVISEYPSLTPPIETGITQNTYYYPKVDLEFNKTYYWKVVAVQAGVETAPANLGTMAGWTFQTVANTDYWISSTIPSNRTLTEANSPYQFRNSPATAENTVLTIQGGVTLQFAENTKLVIGGDIVAKGTNTNGITFTKYGAEGLWQGIELKHANVNHSPLLVYEDGSYLSGSLLQYVTIENAKTPIFLTAPAGTGKVDIYFDNVTFANNETGIDLGLDSKSYFKGVSFEDFKENNTPNKFVVKGGHSFDDVTIDGIIGTDKFVGSAIQSNDKNLIVKNSTIKNLTGNGIDINTVATDGAAYIYGNTINDIGSLAANYAIKAAAGATVVENTIQDNFANAIFKGKYIANNTIKENKGNGAIEADLDATVINNTINDNAGFAIKNGINISNNTITNSDPVVAEHVIKDAITASPTAKVANNTLTNVAGFAINGGKNIFKNEIINLATASNTGFTAANSFAINASANQDAVVEENKIYYPMGFAIQNGKTIKNNKIIGSLSNIETGNFAIKAEIGAEVINNEIKNIKGPGIENGLLIHNNTIENVINYVKADPAGVVTQNTLKGGVLGNNHAVNYAILNGSIINSNTITGIKSGGTTELIRSNTMTEFNSNIIGGSTADEINTAQNILAVTKTTGALEIIGNTIENNQYRNDAIRIESTNLTIKDNQILNDYVRRGTGGFIPGIVAPGTGVALYVKANDANSVIEGNIITGHQGYKDGAAIYLESVAASKVTVKSNVISNNHINHAEARGAAIFHNALGKLEVDNNTITFNYISTIAEGDEGYSPISVGSAIYTNTPANATSDALKINNNIIASNGGKWAIYGSPRYMNNNNLYDNTIDGLEEVWGATFPELDNHGMNLKLPLATSYVPDATNNFWGTRSDLGNIDPSIFDDNELASLPAVIYQPILTGPSQSTPGIVSNISGISVTSSEDKNNITGIINLPVGEEIWATILADDNNDYSNDYTEVIVHNTRTGQYLSLLLKEKGKNISYDLEVYKDSFTLVDDATGYNPVLKTLPVISGDQIVISSTSDPMQRVTLNAALTGYAALYPYVNKYDFGTWEDGTSITKKFTLTNSGAIPLVFESSNALDITGTDLVQFTIVNASAFNGASIAPGASVDIVVTYTAASGLVTHEAKLEIDFTDDPSDREIELSGTSIATWNDLQNNDQFGSPVLKTNQMTMHISEVQINGTPADAGSRIAAYVVTNLQEELRGNAVVQNGGAATLVINTDVSDENVIFKVWDATNHVIYDSPYTVTTVPGATVNQRAPIVINALSQYSLSGTVTDGNPTGLDAILVNRHEKADINPNTNRPFEYSTLADGNYTFLAWQGTPMILEAVKSGYSFVADGTVVGSNLEANAGDFTYPASGTNYPAGTVYVTAGFNGGGTTTITDAGALTAVHTGLDFTGTIEQFVVTGNLSFEDMPLVGVTMTISGGGSITTDESGNFFFVVNSGTSGTDIITITQSDLNAAGYGEILLSATPLNISTDDPIVSDTHLGNVLTPDDFAANAGKITQTISLTTGWNLISFNVEHADDSPDAVFGTVHAIKEVRTRDKVWDKDSSIGTLEHIEANKSYYVRADAGASLTAIGKPVPITEITLDQNNWNLIGYPMQLNGQTRTMIKDNADILNINDLKEAYYHIDEPIGASTLRFMMPGSGYWMKTGTVSDPKLNYNQDYSNVIKSLEFRDVANESWVKAEIDNKAAGFPLPVGAT